MESSKSSSKVLISAIQDEIISAGPGIRTEVFFYGCSRGCKGCINSWTIDQPYYNTNIDYVMNEILRLDNLHISIGGGEPFEQEVALLELCQRLHVISIECGLIPDILIYTGFSLEDIITSDVIKFASWLVTEPFIEELKYVKTYTSFVGSSNQKVYKRQAYKSTDSYIWKYIPLTESGDIKENF